MSKHTPGPWKWTNGHDKRLAPYIRSDARQLAICQVTVSGCHSEYEANARLIAQAPALLAALKAAQARLCEHCPQGDIETNAGEHTDECLAAMEAIEKAEGGTK